MNPRKIVAKAPIHRPVNTTHEFTFGLLDEFEDARKVETPGGVRVSPTQTSLEFYGCSHLM
jgi:hypothetical protein